MEDLVGIDNHEKTKRVKRGNVFGLGKSLRPAFRGEGEESRPLGILGTRGYLGV